MEIKFTVPGEPVPKARPRVTRQGAYTPRKTLVYEARVAQAWYEQSGFKMPDDTALVATIHAYFPIPQSYRKGKRERLKGEYHKKRGDLDNVVKSVLDALNGRAFKDDSAVAIIEAVKRYSEEPRTDVVIMEAGGEDELRRT